MNELKRIESMHEQREPLINLVPLNEGTWIEEIDFDKKTEKVDVKQRLIIEKIETETYSKKGKKKEILILTCRKADIKKETEETKTLAEDVIEKHGHILKASLIKCFSEGLMKTDVQDMRSIERKLQKGGINIQEDKFRGEIDMIKMYEGGE